MATKTRERFTVVQPLNRSADPAEHAADQAELREAEEWIADQKLTQQGGRRVSEWTWTEFTEGPSEHLAEIVALADRIGQPWHPEDPGDLITEDDVRRLREAGPQRYRIITCWAVRV